MKDDLLDEFLWRWYGYGNGNSDFWVIGPEPGGHPDQLESRVHAWETLGKRMLVDAKAFHSLINEPRWFTPPVQVQPTWKKIIITYLAYRNIAITEQSIANTQQKLFGNGNIPGITNLYLGPLSSPRMSHWGYDFITREVFYDKILPNRIYQLKKAIQGMNNITVLMLGVSAYDHYHKIIDDTRDIEIIKIGDTEVQFQKGNKNNYFLVPHPMAHSVPLSFWKALGDFAYCGNAN